MEIISNRNKKYITLLISTIILKDQIFLNYSKHQKKKNTNTIALVLLTSLSTLTVHHVVQMKSSQQNRTHLGNDFIPNIIINKKIMKNIQL
jgi:hypothetical protein